ncbi:MAG: hypothetical protein MJ221_00990 [Bacilli bacterium]|nr:hypothetical protein [Bacilli bacterium]
MPKDQTVLFITIPSFLFVLAASLLTLIGLIYCGLSKSKYFRMAFILLIISIIASSLTLIPISPISTICSAVAQLSSIFIKSRIVKGCGEVSRSNKVKKLSFFVILSAWITTGLKIAIALLNYNEQFAANIPLLLTILSSSLITINFIHSVTFIVLLVSSYKTVK